MKFNKNKNINFDPKHNIMIDLLNIVQSIEDKETYAFTEMSGFFRGEMKQTNRFPHHLYNTIRYSTNEIFVVTQTPYKTKILLCLNSMKQKIHPIKMFVWFEQISSLCSLLWSHHSTSFEIARALRFGHFNGTQTNDISRSFRHVGRYKDHDHFVVFFLFILIFSFVFTLSTINCIKFNY